MTARQVERVHVTPTGIRRTAQLRHCPRCGAPVLAGLDGNVCALPAHADPAPITERDEYLAVVAGRRTYDAVTVAGRIRLDHRDRFRLRALRRWTVLAAHACPGVVPDLTWIPTPDRPADDEGCPF